jgi:phosphoenolpyruvate synthase/pyruvate phosphate dikinase
LTMRAAATTAGPHSEGRVASPGKATGPARIVKSVVDIGKVRDGDVLVVVATDPGFLPAFKRCVAVVCEEGSPLSHTAIVAREMRLPCLAGVERATRGRFLDGDVITVDADAGRIVRERGGV